MMHPEIAPWQVAAGLHNASSPPPRNNQGPTMRDTAKHRAEMIEHRNKALALCGQANELIVVYPSTLWLRPIARIGPVAENPGALP